MWSFFLSVYFLVPWFDAGILATFEGLSGSLVLCFELSFSCLPAWSLVKTLALHVTIRAVVFIGPLELTVLFGRLNSFFRNMRFFGQFRPSTKKPNCF